MCGSRESEPETERQRERQRQRKRDREREPEKIDRQTARVLWAGFSLIFFLRRSSLHPSAMQGH